MAMCLSDGLRQWLGKGKVIKMKTMKRILPVIVLSMLMVLAIGMISAAYATIYTGSGSDYEWTFDDVTQELTVKAKSGHTDAWVTDNSTFQEYKSQIRYIVLDEGIYYIDVHAFDNYPLLEEVEFQNPNLWIRGGAFRSCPNLKKITLPGTAKLECIYFDEYGEANDDIIYGCEDKEKLEFHITGTSDVLNSDAAQSLNVYGYNIYGFGRSFAESTYIDNVDSYDESGPSDDPPFDHHSNTGDKAYIEKKYTGKNLTPKPYVRIHDDYPSSTIALGTDYSISFSNNKNVGLAKCVLKGMGSFYGNRTVYFVIYPKGTSITKTVPARKAFTVKWLKQDKKMSKKRITGYKILYSAYKDFRITKSKTVKGYKKTAAKIKGLKSKKRYYVKVATYYKNSRDTYLSSWSKAKAVKTK